MSFPCGQIKVYNLLEAKADPIKLSLYGDRKRKFARIIFTKLLNCIGYIQTSFTSCVFIFIQQFLNLLVGMV